MHSLHTPNVDDQLCKGQEPAALLTKREVLTGFLLPDYSGGVTHSE